MFPQRISPRVLFNERFFVLPSSGHSLSFTMDFFSLSIGMLYGFIVSVATVTLLDYYIMATKPLPVPVVEEPVEEVKDDKGGNTQKVYVQSLLFR